MAPCIDIHVWAGSSERRKKTVGGPSRNASVRVIGPLGVASLVRELFVFFVLGSYYTVFFDTLPGSLLCKGRFSVFSESFGSTGFVVCNL